MITPVFDPQQRPTHNAGIIVEPAVDKRRYTRFEVWAWSPIISFQVGLTAGYVALVYFGISGLISQPPSFDTTVPEWYVGYWAIALIVGAALSAFGSISRNKWFERLETVGSTLLTLTIGSYALIVLWLAYAVGDSDKVAGGAGFTALTVPILIRCMWLFSQLLRPRK